MLIEEMESKLRSVWFKYHQWIMPKDTDLSALQLFLLKFVESKPKCTPSDIAHEFRITLGAVTGLIDRLVKLKLVARDRSEEDRRLVLIRLTPKGVDELNQFEQGRQENFLLLLESFGATDVQELSQLLDKFDTVLEVLIAKQTKEK